MAEVKVFYDKVGNTLTVWFSDPNLEHVSEETGDEVVLMKDSAGRVIGLRSSTSMSRTPIHFDSHSKRPPPERAG